ncbi:hypothetical protein [Paenibacillus sp. GCM10027626]|uniref:hypothetical protein n=1 Tax=Paenibacillus sp. GCM10027626 TaxID=3273411 RepID=UPI003624CAA7
MITVILMVSAIICWSVVWATYKPQAKYNKGMLFAVMLPEHAMEHEEIARIRQRFRQQFFRANSWVAITLGLVAVLHLWTAYQVIYSLIWYFGFFFVMIAPFRHAFRQTLALKREQGWFIGSKQVVLSDLRAARLKNQRMAPLSLFIVPFIIAAGFIVLTGQKWQDDISVAIIFVIGLLLTVMFFALSLAMRRMKAKVYSMDSEVNVLLNQSRRRMLSYLWWWLAIAENIHMFFIYNLLANENAAMDDIWIASIVLFSLIPVVMIYLVYRKLNELEQEVLSQDDKPVYTDDDEYWANGFTYHNPYDKSVFVAKRVGMGETINTATIPGKILVGAVIGISAAVVLGVSFLLIRSEVTSPQMSITAGQRIEVSYPMYNYEFDLAAIEQLELVDEVPSGRKSNGEATDKYARGHFRLDGLGKTRLYIYKNNTPYIRIKLDGAYLFYNDKDPANTRKLFEQLERASELNRRN